MSNHTPIDMLVRQLAALPGLGKRSARRIALHLLQNKDRSMLPLTHALQNTAQKIQTCESCGNLDSQNPCHICTSPKRNTEQICVVAKVSDLWAIEKTAAFKGQYFVLGGLLSALDGIGPNDLKLNRLQTRAKELGCQEIILALSATVDGQSTAHYIADQFQGQDIAISRLAHGVPIGGELDYLDDGTITTALKRRVGE